MPRLCNSVMIFLTYTPIAYCWKAIVTQIADRKTEDSICVLTNTNDEALQIVGLLTQAGRRAKLIQSIDGFKLHNLIEIRFFINEIDSKLSSPVISNELWGRAKEKLKMRYKTSACLENCLAMLADFEATNRTKYRSDLEEFINESNFEDFYRSETGVIFVSTIHKAKGREFDCVYLLLNHVNLDSDENKRKVYVGITRAKNELYIHYNNDLFSGYDLEVTEDTVNYGESEEITLQLTHKDVFLDYFKDKQEAILDLRSGDGLQIDDNFLQTPRNGRLYSIVRFSKAFVEKINKLTDMGYAPSTATVRFTLWWKPKDEEKEMAIVLPEMKFTREM